MKEITKKN